MSQDPITSDDRTPARVRAHYEIEKDLANKLRNAPKSERRHLYSALYDELFRRVPDHPQLTRRSSAVETASAIRSQVKFLKRFVNNKVTFLEIGSGDCALSLEVTKFAKKVYALDVSGEIAGTHGTATNFEFLLSDGCGIPLSPNSIDVAYSNQVMEHLHPDDAVDQLQNIQRALVPGGLYLCVTPNRLAGPHDVSMYFDAVATGFHLKEYTIAELSTLFKESGFSRIRSYIGARGVYVRFSVALLVFCEKCLCALPRKIRRSIARSLLFRMLLNVRLGATK